MSTTVKSMKITYDAINEDNTFSSGDVITARIILEISKEAKINSLSIKAKGEAHVHWKEGHGDDERSYSANERYFKLKQFMIQPPKDDGKDSEKLLADHSGETYSDVVAPGIHLYPFTFQIPQRDMPSSFTGIHGKIAYTLEAKLSRSMRMAKTAMAEFTFITKNNMVDDTLLSSQSGSVQKKMKLFTSGNVSMNANMERMGYMQGERMKITAEIENKSSRALVPKFSLDQTQTFIAQSSTNSGRHRILKEVGETIPSSTQQTITKELCIPPDLQPSILNCSIIKVEYILKVYLDVPYARDPEIIFPLVILPVSISSGFAQMMQSCSSVGFQPFGNINQAGWNIYPPQFVPGPYAPQTVPGPFAPQTVPGPLAPQTVPGPFSPQPAPGPFSPQTVPGPYAPQTAPAPFAPQPVPELYPPLPD